MKRFIEISFDHMVAHQHFVALLGDENTHKARHVKQSGQLIDMHDRLEKNHRRDAGTWPGECCLQTGCRSGRTLYLHRVALLFYLSNRYTLSTIFDRDVTGEEEFARRRTHVVDILMSYLTSAPT